VGGAELLISFHVYRFPTDLSIPHAVGVFGMGQCIGLACVPHRGWYHGSRFLSCRRCAPNVHSPISPSSLHWIMKPPAPSACAGLCMAAWASGGVGRQEQSGGLIAAAAAKGYCFVCSPFPLILRTLRVYCALFSLREAPWRVCVCVAERAVGCRGSDRDFSLFCPSLLRTLPRLSLCNPTLLPPGLVSVHVWVCGCWAL
jgi:hypothetical protein